jgi:3-isopropylmalate/(R)-2-methylmalate dehydratase small subunit
MSDNWAASMETFTVLDGIAAPLLVSDVNTDVIIRIERVIEYPRGQLGPWCFEAWRYHPDGSENPDFILNTPSYRGASVLLCGSNFGCGSSREAAVWALWDLGVRCVIAPSFGEIFYENCFLNGMLPMIMPGDEIASLADAVADAAPLRIDLVAQRIVAAGHTRTFTVEPSRRQVLLDGADQITVTLKNAAAIDGYQNRSRATTPWIFKIDPLTS